MSRDDVPVCLGGFDGRGTGTVAREAHRVHFEDLQGIRVRVKKRFRLTVCRRIDRGVLNEHG